MKIFFTVIILLFFVTNSFAQKIEKDEIDKFNGRRIVNTTTEIISKAKDDLNVYGLVIKDTSFTSYTICFFFPANEVISITNENNATLLLASGAKLVKSFKGKYKIYSGDEFAAYRLSFTKDELQKLSSDAVTDIRFELSSGYRDFVIDENRKDIVANVCKLITAY